MTPAEALIRTLESPDVCDSNGENANVVDAIAYVARAAYRVADSITPKIAPGTDETGGHVESLTEAVMGVTSGLFRIAEAIESLAEAVNNRQ